MADGTPTVSIVIPCYRCEATIVETARSVVAQTFGDWECILVSDDGRSYLELLAGNGIVDERFREHPERTCRTGTVLPRNRGMQMVRGRFVADLDADDRWAPERLEKLLPHAEESGLVQDVLELFDEDGIIGYSGTPDGALKMLGPADILQFDFPFHVIVRRDLLGSEWFWHDSYVPDVLRSIWLASGNPMCWVREPLLKYRVSKGSMSQSLQGAQKVDASYTDILNQFASGGFPLIPEEERQACIAGFERKRALNRKYMEFAECLPDPPSFLAWVLSTGVSGALPAGG